jgi:hypothetical protein
MAVFATALIRTIHTRDAHGTPRKVFVYQDVLLCVSELIDAESGIPEHDC